MIQQNFIDEYGNTVFRELGIIEQMYFSTPLEEISIDSQIEINSYNKYIDKFALREKHLTAYEEPTGSVQDFHNQRHDWQMPTEYAELDLLDWFANRVVTDEELTRVAEELQLFQKHQFEPVLKFLIYLVDVMKENEIIWGVGRGSSVASYCLYLIGIHKINSLEHDLDIKEFLK